MAQIGLRGTVNCAMVLEFIAIKGTMWDVCNFERCEYLLKEDLDIV